MTEDPQNIGKLLFEIHHTLTQKYESLISTLDVVFDYQKYNKKQVIVEK